eukprot:SAG11_NODE_197_length_12691_cov_20.904145_7_plen_188_part_00
MNKCLKEGVSQICTTHYPCRVGLSFSSVASQVLRECSLKYTSSPPASLEFLSWHSPIPIGHLGAPDPANSSRVQPEEATRQKRVSMIHLYKCIINTYFLRLFFFFPIPSSMPCRGLIVGNQHPLRAREQVASRQPIHLASYPLNVIVLYAAMKIVIKDFCDLPLVATPMPEVCWKLPRFSLSRASVD